MDFNQLIEQKKLLITSDNAEWQNILELITRVQKDFANNQCLAIDTYHNILDWKLKDKKSQIEKIKGFSPDTLITSITKCYNEISHPDVEMEIKIKMHILLGIPWIGIGIASAIMALHQPKQLAFFDSNLWHSLFLKDKKTFSVTDYMNYLHKVRELATEAKCDVCEVGYVLSKQQ